VLKVFNMLGGEVATLVNGELAVGEHSVVWSAGNIPAGTYDCRLQTSTTAATVRLSIVR
jgi:hypothetical protein